MSGNQGDRPSLAMWLTAASLLLLAANLRPLFSSMSVLLPDLTQGLGLNNAQAGYLTTLPVLCMGLFAPLAPRLAQRIGIERTLFLVLICIGLGTVLRGSVGVTGLFAGTALAGAGIALGNVLLPSLVKRDYARQAALMTGLYTMSLVGGAALGAAATLPLVHGLGLDWTGGLALWAAPAALALLAWAPAALRSEGHGSGRRRTRPVRGLHRDGLAWAVTVFMGLQSALGYSVMGWMAPILRDRGMNGTEAGLVTSISIFTQVVSCLLVPMLASRFRDQRMLAVVLTLITTLSLVGMTAGPLLLVWPLAFIQGIGQGGMFALALMLIVLRSPDSDVAAHLSGMSQTSGYVLACLGPLLIGLLHEWTGSFHAASALMAVLGTISGVAGWLAGRNALVRAQVVEPAPTRDTSGTSPG
jgi:CP family cyanate transporter-like MFS transporter